MMMPSSNSSSRSCLLKTLLLLAALCGSASAANNIGRIDAVADIEGVGVGADPNPTKKVVFASPTSSSSSAATPQDAPVIDRRRNNRDLMKKATHKVKRKKSPANEDPFVWPESTKSAKAAEAETSINVKTPQPQEPTHYPAAEAEVKELVDSAKTYIQLGSYDEAFDHAHTANGRIGSGHSPNMYILLDAAYLEVIQLKRRQLYKYKNMIAEQPAEDVTARSLLMKQIAKVQDEIVQMSMRYIDHLESRFTLKTPEKELAALHKTIGDIYFVMAGVQEGVHRTISFQNAEAAYNKAGSYASGLLATHPIVLGIAFSMTNFYLALNQPERSHTIAEVAVEVAAQTGLVHLPEVFQDATCSAEEASRMTSDPCTPCPLRLDEDHDDPDCCSVAKILACKMTDSLHDYLNDEVNGEVSLSITYAVHPDGFLDLKEFRHSTFRQIVSGDDADVPHLSEDVFRDKLEEAGSSPESELKEGWAATPLQSSNVAWKYGVSGPFWYASGATIQVLLFHTLAESIAQTEIETIDVSLSNDLMFSVGQIHSPEAHNHFLGGTRWFAIPFSLATSLGLASAALMLPIAMNEAGSGLVPPAVADSYLLGDSVNQDQESNEFLGGVTIASGGVLPNIHTPLLTTSTPSNLSTEKQQIIVNGKAPAVSLTAYFLGKQWQNIGQMYIKSTMGPAQQIFF